MTIVRRPSSLGEFVTLRQAMDRFFDDDVFRPFRWTAGAIDGPGLPLDVTTTPDELVVQASLPGIKPAAVEITVENGTLTISGTTAEEARDEGASYLVQEIRRGSFSRSVTLPNGLEPDKASATFEDGLLTLRIPKAEQVKPRQIRISPVSDAKATRTAEVTAGTGKS
ncbi:MAG: Hsp20/alpha crystallin family protein [Chloroflexi bacterium]|nr:Hsp20/alpha crystallin family protein [Chloroflexota bacterium]